MEPIRRQARSAVPACRSLLAAMNPPGSPKYDRSPQRERHRTRGARATWMSVLRVDCSTECVVDWLALGFASFRGGSDAVRNSTIMEGIHAGCQSQGPAVAGTSRSDGH